MYSITKISRIVIPFLIFGFGVCTSGLAGDPKVVAEKEPSGASFKLDHAPTYLFPDQIPLKARTPGDSHRLTPQMPLGSTLSPGTTLAETTYDLQYSGTGGRKVAIDLSSGLVYMVWTCQSNTEMPGDRGVCFAAYDLGFGATTVVGDATGADYAGIATTAVQPGGGPVFACNGRNSDPDSLFHSRYYYDYAPGLYVFQYTIVDNGRQTLWPQIATHDADNPGVTENVTYVLAHDHPDSNDIYLYRKVGDGEWDGGVYMATTTDISYTIVADPSSDRVAMVYTDDRAGLAEGAGGQNDLDVYYRLSEDQGAAWGDPIDVSNYTLDSLWRAYADVSALWTGDGALHVIWAARELVDQNTYYNYRSRLMHWSSDLQTASIVDEARYVTVYGGSECDPGSWSMYIADPSLSQCDDNLYVLYTKFGDDNEPGALSDCSDGGYANGELYMAGSDDGGLSWDTSGNITRSRTPGCAAGECESDAWSSMALYGIPYGDESVPDTLDIIYINDLDAGAIPQGEGSWTLNNVKYLRLPCRDVPHVPRISPEPLGFTDAFTMHITEGDSLILPLILINIGNGTLTISDVRAEYYDSSGWIAFGPYEPSVPKQGADTISVTFNAGTMLTGYSSDFGRVYEADIIITSDAPSSEDTVPVQVIVQGSGGGYICSDVMSTTKTLRVCNTGRLGTAQQGASLDIPGDCDADLDHPNGDLYLYDASPVIAYRRNDSNFAFTMMYTQIPGDPGTFKALSTVHTSSVTGAEDYNMAVCTLSTADDVIGVNMTYIAPTDGNDFVYVIYECYPLAGADGLDQVYVGFIADWDIPSDIGVKNGSGYDGGTTPPIIWQRGTETDPTDEDAPHSCPILENDRFGGIALFDGGIRNAWTANLPVLGYDTGLNPDSLYDRMSGLTGYNIYAGVGADSIVDLITGITFAKVDMSSGGTYTIVAGLMTTNQGLTDLYDQAAGAAAWAVDWPFPPPCYCQPGNANGGESIDIGDAVYLINRIFKGGPPPTPYVHCSGDPNGDCAVNIGDPVYIINYIFKGGPEPVDCTTWVQSCGSYER